MNGRVEYPEKVVLGYLDDDGRFIENGKTLSAGDFDADKSVGTAAVREAIPTGARGFLLTNTHASQILRARTGDVTVVATTTSGYYAGAGDILEEAVNPAHTHISVIGSGAATTYSLIWKF